jgi:hypothetical protein
MHKLQMVGPELLLIRMDANGGLAQTTGFSKKETIYHYILSANRFEAYSFHYMFVFLEWRTGTIVSMLSDKLSKSERCE